MNERRIRSNRETEIPARLPQTPPTLPVMVGEKDMRVSIKGETMNAEEDKRKVKEKREKYEFET